MRTLLNLWHVKWKGGTKKKSELEKPTILTKENINQNSSSSKLNKKEQNFFSSLKWKLKHTHPFLSDNLN